MDVIVKGQPSIEVRMEAKVVDSYKTADAALSESSVNPVQNKVVTAELGEKATKTELSALDTKVTENKTATDTAVSALSAKVDEEVESVQTQLDSHDILIENLQENKADTTGYYPQLSVGQADNLPDRGDVNEGLLGFRESAGAGNSIEDGVANVQELLGESLVWNQHSNIKSHFTNDNTSATSTKYALLGLLPYYTTAIDGHKIFAVASDSEGKLKSIYFNDLLQKSLLGGCLFTASTTVQERTSVFAEIDAGVSVDTDVEVFFFDLTQMFGAGNEPTTIEEFEARTSQLVGVDFNAYNEGEVLGVNIKGIKSVNDNAFNGEYAKVLGGREYCADGTITSLRFAKEIGGATEAILLDSENKFTPSENGYVYASGTDICIHLVHTGYKDHVYTAHEESESSFDLTPYFPNGMHGINGVRDSVTKSKAKRRFGVVDMGTLNWSAFTTKNGLSRTSATISGFIGGQGAEKSNILCAKFVTIVANTSMAGNEELGIFGYTNNRIFVLFKEGDYTDAASFKAAMSGVMLYYELATPIETEIDPQLNMNYKVWDFGTEELLTNSKSAPVLARTIYGFNATDTIRGNKAKNEEQDVRLGEIERTMVQKEDYAPALTSGFADNLVGSDVIVDKDFTIRKSGDGAILDGAARMEVVKGNSVVWNQLFRMNYNNLISNGVTCTLQNDNSIQIAGQLTDTHFNMNTFSANVATHKYLFVLSGATSVLNGKSLVLLNRNLGGTISNGYAYIFHTNSDPSKNTYIGLSGFSTGDTISETLYVCQYDLTQMFGAGDEPTTIEEFYARKPIVEDEYAYNEGEVIHCNVDAVKSVGRNVWDEEWELGFISSDNGVFLNNSNNIRSKNFIRILPNTKYYLSGSNIQQRYYDENLNYIGYGSGNVSNMVVTTPQNAHYFAFYTNGTTYNHDICINLSDPDFNGKYEPYKEDIKEIPTAIKEAFPEGMMSAGTAHDVAYNDMNKEVGVTEKRIGVVDLGSLDWVKSSWGFTISYSQVQSLNMAFGQISAVSNCICNRYSPAPTYDIENLDKVMRMPLKNAYSNTFTIKDTSYTDAATFKEAMQGVMLYYELAEPIVTEHDEPFNLDYQVANGGQEQAIANKKTSAFNAKIAYGFNAAAKIKENANEIENLKTIITQLQAAIASMVSTTTEEVE